jgi:hypothetical protein
LKGGFDWVLGSMDAGTIAGKARALFDAEGEKPGKTPYRDRTAIAPPQSGAESTKHPHEERRS